MEVRLRTRILEIVAVLATGLGKFVFMDFLNLKLPFIISACLFWFCYVFYRYKRNNQITDYWGLSMINFKSTFRELSPFLLVLIIVFVSSGYWLETSVLNLSIIPILIIYPIWGIIQQFIIIALLAKNLKEQEKVLIPDYLIIVGTAIIFSIVHYPFPYLMIGTFFLALAYTFLYLKNRNLVVLGIFHGWLGAFFYYCILGRDTFSEVFKMIG